MTWNWQGRSGERAIVMKKLSVMVLAAFIAAGVAVMPAQAKEGKIEAGIYVDDIDISG